MDSIPGSAALRLPGGSVAAPDKDLAKDLTWINVLKGMAIIGVVFDHWIPFWEPSDLPGLNAVLRRLPWGPPVQLFFLLSGFGLMMAYLKQNDRWSWGRWIWRRMTKIVIPYWMAVLVSIQLGILGSLLYESVDIKFSVKSLVGLITFTRMFVPGSWEWNVAYWYMPVIIGLYLCFPLLAWILRKKGPLFLFVSAALITYGSIVGFAVLAGRYGGHNEALALCFLVQFALGMILALVRMKNPDQLKRLIGLGPALLGTGLCLASWILTTQFVNGKAFNDLLTTVGVFLIFINLFWITRSKMPSLIGLFSALGQKSYLIFLIHYPILAFIIGPPMQHSLPSLMVPVLGLVFVAGMYFLCLPMAKPIDKLASLSAPRVLGSI